MAPRVCIAAAKMQGEDTICIAWPYYPNVCLEQIRSQSAELPFGAALPAVAIHVISDMMAPWLAGRDY